MDGTNFDDALTGEQKIRNFNINFGPQHPAAHGVLRLVLELDGERVARCTPHIGYLHSGFEKLGEHHDYNQYVCTVSRMDYVSPICNDIAWHHAVERLFGIELTPRAKVLRHLVLPGRRVPREAASQRLGGARRALGGELPLLLLGPRVPGHDDAALGANRAVDGAGVGH